MKDTADPPRLLIAWHSRTGASEAMAAAAAQSATEYCAVDLLKAHKVGPETMFAASAYLFVCPENLGSMSGEMKEMFDRCYYPILGDIEGRAYGSITAAGSDGEGALKQLDRIVTGWRLRRVVDSLIINLEAQTPEAIMAPKTLQESDLDKCREIGSTLGAGLDLGLF